jgi:hypothetical protein
MKLLGDWNWYLPRWLQWLPSVGHHEAAPVPAPANPPARAPAPAPPELEPEPVGA